MEKFIKNPIFKTPHTVCDKIEQYPKTIYSISILLR